MIRLLYIPRQELKSGKMCPKMVVLETHSRRIFLALSDMRDFLKVRRLPLQTARR